MCAVYGELGFQSATKSDVFCRLKGVCPPLNPISLCLALEWCYDEVSLTVVIIEYLCVDDTVRTA